VTETIAPIAENPRSSTAARIGWAILILATLYVCYFSHLGAIGFVGPDEPRYAWVARDMVETGDWVTPRLYGKPWFEKPVLYYWGAAVCFKLFGVSEAAARLPSAISALLATLALAWLALRLYGAETARWLLLLLPTTVGMIGFSHAAATDMPFSGMLTIAMVCAAVGLGLTRDENTPILPRTPWLALILFGFFLGLAVLAKGPAAIILSGGAIFFWALFTKRWRDAFRLLHPAAIASFCLTALPWYILCAVRNPDFFRIFIIEHNFKRYLTPEFQHLQPFWYYVPVLLVAFLPWTGILLWTAAVGGTQIVQPKKISSASFFLLCWFLFVVFFFTLSRSKLPGYILPAFPSICLIAARACVASTSAHRKSFRFSLIIVAVFLFLLLVLVRMVAPNISFGNEKFGGIAGLIIALMGLANVFLGIFCPSCSGNDLRNSFKGTTGKGNEPRPALQLEFLPSRRGPRMGGGASPRGIPTLGKQVLWETIGIGPHMRRNSIQSGKDWFLSLPDRTTVICWAARQRATSLERMTRRDSHTCACPHPPNSQNFHAG
jgi:4-amino-4-deoxy-L-arabinose transferase-like glycosyltransferase